MCVFLASVGKGGKIQNSRLKKKTFLKILKFDS
jgi:hypothetical protein